MFGQVRTSPTSILVARQVISLLHSTLSVLFLSVIVWPAIPKATMNVELTNNTFCKFLAVSHSFIRTRLFRILASVGRDFLSNNTIHVGPSCECDVVLHRSF